MGSEKTLVDFSLEYLLQKDSLYTAIVSVEIECHTASILKEKTSFCVYVSIELKGKLPAAFPHEIMPVSPPTFLGSLASDAAVVERARSKVSSLGIVLNLNRDFRGSFPWRRVGYTLHGRRML
jgi:hypothetical protein